MVQAPRKPRKRPLRANITLIATCALSLIMLVLLAVFFRVGQTPQEEKRVLSPEKQREVNALFFNVAKLRQEGKLAEACQAAQKTIDILEKEKPDNWLTLAMILVTQSDMYRELRQWDKGLPAIKRAREIVETHHLEEDRLTCEIVLREGIFKYANGDVVEAEELMQQALNCTQTLFGYLSLETTQNLLWIAQLNVTPALNKPQRALQYLRTVEEVCNSSQPERPLQMMTCLTTEGKAFTLLKKHSEAEEKLLAAQEIAERLFPDPTNGQRMQIADLLKTARAGK